MKSKTYMILLLIIIFSFFIRFYTSQNIWINADEGNYLYDAHNILEGKMPIRDYLTRSILLIYPASISMKLVGTTIMGGRILSVIFSLLSLLFVFKIGKELYNEKIGLLSAFIYAVSPLTIFYTSLLITEPIQQLFIIVAMYFLIIGLKNNQSKYFILNGLFLGLAFFVRRSAGIFFPAELFLILYMYRKNVLEAIQKTLFVWIGSLLIAIPLLGYFVYHSSFELVYQTLGFSGTFSGYTNPMNISLLANKTGIFYLLIKTSLYLIAPTFLFFAYILKNENIKKYLPHIVIIFSLLFVFGDFYAYYFLDNVLNINKLFLMFFSAIIILTAISLSSIVKSKVNLKKYQNLEFSNVFLMFWFLSLFLFYLVYPKWHLAYFSEFSAVFSLITAVVVFSLLNKKPNRIWIFITVLIFSAILVQPSYFYRSEESWSIYDIQETADYISLHTKENEEIFTGLSSVPYLANRNLVLDISHPLLYSYLPKLSADELHLVHYPTIEELITHLDVNVNYAVIEPYTEHAFFNKNPELKEYFYSNYYPEKQINENLWIYRKK